MNLDDDLFQHLPVPAVQWAAPRGGHVRQNPAFKRVFAPGTLSVPLPHWTDGVHLTRLQAVNGEYRVCRVTLSTLPGQDRLAIIEDVHSYHLDPVTHLPDRDALLHDAAQTHGVTTLATLRLPPLHDHRRQLGDAPVDQALRRAARELTSAARTWNASAYRTGTHEFTLLSPQALTPDQLAPVTRRIHTHLSALGRTAEPRVGLSDAPHDGRTLADLLAAAQDRAAPPPPARPLDRLKRLLHPTPTHPMLAL